MGVMPCSGSGLRVLIAPRTCEGCPPRESVCLCGNSVSK